MPDTPAATTEPTQIVSRETLSRGFGHLEEIVFRRRRSDGAMNDLTREILDTGDGAAILPYDRSRNAIILIRQFRGVAFLKQGHEGLVEICAGKLEGEEPVTRIIKETQEETGLHLSGEPRFVFEAYSTPGSFAERLFYFVAPYTAADRISKGGGLVAEGEDIEVLEMSLDDGIAMIESGAIIDLKTIAMLYYARATGLME